jgi:hypothetical protein
MQSLAADLIDYAHDHVVERRRKMMRERHFWWAACLQDLAGHVAGVDGVGRPQLCLQLRGVGSCATATAASLILAGLEADGYIVSFVGGGLAVGAPNGDLPKSPVDLAGWGS